MTNATRGRRKANKTKPPEGAEGQRRNTARTGKQEENNTNAALEAATNDASRTANTAEGSEVASTDNSSNHSEGRLKYKRVNDWSQNCRTCLCVSRELLRSTTPDRDNMTVVTNSFTTRATLKLTLPSSTKPLEQISNIIKEFTRELQQADESAALIPWKEREQGQTCLTPNSKMPTTVTGFKLFLNRLYLP